MVDPKGLLVNQKIKVGDHFFFGQSLSANVWFKYQGAIQQKGEEVAGEAILYYAFKDEEGNSLSLEQIRMKITARERAALESAINNSILYYKSHVTLHDIEEETKEFDPFEQNGDGERDIKQFDFGNCFEFSLVDGQRVKVLDPPGNVIPKLRAKINKNLGEGISWGLKQFFEVNEEPISEEILERTREEGGLGFEASSILTERLVAIFTPSLATKT